MKIEDSYWQQLETSNGTFKMFNAYYDNRSFYKDQPLVRILAYINVVDPTVKTFCQLWFKDFEEPVTSEVFEYRLLWSKHWTVNKKGSQPHLIACRNPMVNEGRIPVAVSLVENECDTPTSNLKINYNIPKYNIKKPFAVCAKELEFEDDQSAQLIEWLEILTLLGARKIFTYVIHLHENMMKTLRYYEKRGIVQIEMMTQPKLPSRAESLTQWLQLQMISLTDCFYKHMHEYDFISPLDIDEIIMPTNKEDMNWKDMMIRNHQKTSIGGSGTSPAYIADNVFFLTDNIHKDEIQEEIPRDLFFLQHVYRAANFSKPGVGSKSFHDTEQVLVMHNHFPLECVGKSSCSWTKFDQNIAQLQHYRNGCENYPKDECEGFRQNTVRDETLWKHKDEIIKNVKRAKEELQNFESK